MPTATTRSYVSYAGMLSAPFADDPEWELAQSEVRGHDTIREVRLPDPCVCHGRRARRLVSQISVTS